MPKKFILCKTSRCYYGGPAGCNDSQGNPLEADTLEEAIALSKRQKNPVGYDVYEYQEKALPVEGWEIVGITPEGELIGRLDSGECVNVDQYVAEGRRLPGVPAEPVWCRYPQA